MGVIIYSLGLKRKTADAGDPIQKQTPACVSPKLDGDMRPAIRRSFFTVKTVQHWSELPKEAVKSPSLEVLKPSLDKALSSLG